MNKATLDYWQDEPYDPNGECPECTEGGIGPLCEDCERINEEDLWNNEEQE